MITLTIIIIIIIKLINITINNSFIINITNIIIIIFIFLLNIGSILQKLTNNKVNLQNYIRFYFQELFLSFPKNKIKKKMKSKVQESRALKNVHLSNLITCPCKYGEKKSESGKSQETTKQSGWKVHSEF